MGKRLAYPGKANPERKALDLRHPTNKHISETLKLKSGIATLGTTPAVAARLEEKPWSSLERVVERQTRLHSRRPRRRKQQRAERQRTPCFKRRSQDYAEDRDWLVASRPFRRRLRRRGRCFFLLCHSKSLNGRTSIVER